MSMECMYLYMYIHLFNVLYIYRRDEHRNQDLRDRRLPPPDNPIHEISRAADLTDYGGQSNADEEEEEEKEEKEDR